MNNKINKFNFIVRFFILSVVLFSLPVSAININDVKLCKQRASINTDEKARIAAENITRYAWAKLERDHIVARADQWLANYKGDLGKIWSIPSSQSIPRSFAVNSGAGCLACGTGINKYGNYSYQYDKTKEDWKLTCPNCHLTFPTNDFEAYYKGGLERDGRFNPDKARRYNDALIKKGGKGNLINLYTINGLTTEQTNNLKAAGVSDALIHRITTDPQWGVDNSMGYRFNINDKQKFGNPYTFVAFYSHWVLWYWRVMPMLEDLSNAYMLTRFSSDEAERTKAQTYADAAIVLLDRVADLYPEMKLEPFPRNDYYGFPNSGQHWDTKLNAGRVVGSVWENGFIKSIMFSYDAVFSAIDHLSAAARKVLEQQSGSKGKGNTDRIKKNFEDGVLREVPVAFLEGDLQGNPGMHQSSLAVAAVVMDHNPETIDWLNTVYKNGACEWHDVGKRDGGSVMRYMVNRINRDGEGDEISIGYNSSWLSSWLYIAKILNGYKMPDGRTLAGNIDPDLMNNPRYKKLFETNPLLFTNQYDAHIGDTGLTGQPLGTPEYTNNLIYGFNRYHTTSMAQMIYLLKGKNISNIHYDIFTKNPESIQNEIREVINKYGELNQPSENRSAYGLALMRDSLRTLWMFYGTRCASHNHADPLSMGYIAHGLDLMPEFGYPNTLGSNTNPEQQWDKSTPAHNTVSYDKLGYMGHIVGYGKPLHFDATKNVQLIQASSNKVQNGGTHFFNDYRRTTALIRIDDDESYIADFFHLDCPKGYTYNFHTAEIDPEATRYENVNFKNDIAPVTFNKNTLRNVRTASVSGKVFSVDWNVLDTWNVFGKGRRAHTDIHTKITMPSAYGDIRLGEGVPPTNVDENPKWVPMLMVSGKGVSDFTAVIEGYKGSSKVASVEAVEVKEGKNKADAALVRALKVQLTNGRTDYIVRSLDRTRTYKIDGKFNFRGFFAVYSVDAKGKAVGRYINDGTLLAGKEYQDRLTGTVTDATNTLTEKNYLTVRMDQNIDAAWLKGRYIYVDNDDIPDTEGDEILLKYNAVYPILRASRQQDGTYRLDLGDCSVVRGLNDLNDYSKGYARDFNLGAGFYIPLSHQ